MKTKKPSQVTRTVQNILNRKVQKSLENELKEILRSTDYSKCDISIFYDEQTDRVIVPKHVFALSRVDRNLAAWLIEQINSLPDGEVIVV